ncbi:hypothetical protein RB614_07485 [Phytohabitans sp. ZYX-F-186]|uniref:Uncharacterized protein n=1 Tax=Phytohabitans maris TaxID=3071409 RepID=A0ABU0ZBE6_9ACTN|nr:hypothetical protein [Phytohabitans sp. ZYX-F-186]MDQ7904363.1 hypothetical protein [Phytohabitans sp. ZYX-F-186]
MTSGARAQLADLAEGDIIGARTDEGLIAYIEISSLETTYPTTVTLAATVGMP